MRWSARRKQEVVLRLLRGESLRKDRRAGDGSGHRQGAARRGRAPPSVAEALNVSRRLEALLACVCRVAGVSGSAACKQRRRRSLSESLEAPPHRRPGPVGPMPDDELLATIRREIAESPFVGKGHKAPRSSGTARHPHVGQAGPAPHARCGAAGPDAADPQARCSSTWTCRRPP